MYYAVANVFEMLALARKVLVEYDPREVQELRALWELSSWLRPHMHEIRGYDATSQFGDGMHEILLRKDEAEIVGLHVRKSVQSTTWFPEEPGYEVFASDPGPGPPPLAHYKDHLQWQRQTVESTVRPRCFNHFIHSSELKLPDRGGNAALPQCPPPILTPPPACLQMSIPHHLRCHA
eukprot:270312-Pleurochrysis_carterae.AAC.1